jgi:D-glycero-D-manno-heptose 1,7-bisphosphate phosphatase
MGGRPAVFVDRDGTLIRERSYLSDPKDVELIPGAVTALEMFARCDLPVVLVTNQSGIARGLYSLEDYHRVAERLMDILSAAGVPPAAAEYCPHHPEFSGSCECRKPSAGMHRKAAVHLDLDLERSFYIGDKLSDVAVAGQVGGTGILVRTGYGRDHEANVTPGVRVVDDLLDAAKLIASAVDPDFDLE